MILSNIYKHTWGGHPHPVKIKISRQSGNQNQDWNKIATSGEVGVVMRNYIKLAKKKIDSYGIQIARLQKTTLDNSLNNDRRVKEALEELKKSFDLAKKTAEVLDGNDAPLWWMSMQTGEITNEHIEKLETNYMNLVKMIMKPFEQKNIIRGNLSESRPIPNSHI